MVEKPRTKTHEAEKEIDRLDTHFNAVEEENKNLTLDTAKQAPLKEIEPQTKMSQREIEKSDEIYLKPIRWERPKEKFNEEFRDEYNFQKEYVQFIAENNEIIGEFIELWTKKFPGVNCEFWQVPVNKPVWGPRYLAEQIKNCQYRTFTMNENKIVSTSSSGQIYGQMVVEATKNRLDARPVSSRKSIFMGATNF